MAKKPAIVPSLPPEELPQDLKEKIGAVKALAGTYNFLDKSPVPQVQMESIRNCMAFVHQLYEAAVLDAFNHPQSHQSPDLEHLRRVMAVKDGEAATLADADKVVVAKDKRIRKAKGKLNVVKK